MKVGNIAEHKHSLVRISKKMKISIITGTKVKKIALSFPYNKEIVEKIRSFEGRKWDAEKLQWELPISHLSRLKEMFPYAILTQDVLDYEENQKQLEEKEKEEVDKILAELDLTKPLPDGKILFEHQRTGILRMLKNRRHILADDMGLGKTLQSLVVAKILSGYYGWNIIIICPVSLKLNWEREAVSLQISNNKLSIHSWAKIPDPPKYEYLLIADEAHYAQAGTKTIRGKAFLKLANNINCKACYCLTGTPIKNGRPINLFPLLKAIKHELSVDKSYYQIRYCNAHYRKLGKTQFWDVTGASNLDELNEKLKSVMIRRTKKECLDLPEKLRVLREAELSKEAIELYNKTLDNLRANYNERLIQGLIKEGGEEMIMLQHLAHAGALGKVDTAFELASEVIEEGNQVVIFSTFTEPLKMLKDKLEKSGLPTGLLIGETKDRQKLVDEFLSGTSRAFLLSMAGGVGIDLYTATTIILINRAWTPGDVLQIEDRLHRIGQKNPVTSIWLQYGEADKHVDEILEKKSINISHVLSGRDKLDDEIIKFAKKYFSGVNNYH